MLTYVRVFAAIVTVVSMTVLVRETATVLRQQASANWPSVPGEVRAVITRQEVGEKNAVRFYGRPVYAWTVAGNEHVSDQMTFSRGPMRADMNAALADVDRYKPGMPVTVYYDPRTPSVGILERGLPRRDLYLFMAAITGTIIGGGVTLFSLRALWREFRHDLADASARDAKAEEEEEPLDVRLGRHVELFAAGGTNILAGEVLASLLVMIGASIIGYVLWKAHSFGWQLPLEADRQTSWGTVGVGVLFGSALIGGGVFIWFVIGALRDQDVEICENGFRYRKREKTNEVSWSMVRLIRETILHERSLLLRPPFSALLPRSTSRDYRIFTRSGKEYAFDVNTIGRMDDFTALLRSVAERESLPWETVEETE